MRIAPGRHVATERRPRRTVLAVVGVLIAVLAVIHTPAQSMAPLTVGVAADHVTDLDRFARTTGAQIGIYEWYQAWEGAPPFDAARASSAVGRSALPMLTWEPWAPGGGSAQPRYALARIADGSYDPYISDFAGQVRAWGGVIALRFAHELNGNWYPWGSGVNGNTAEEAVAAWNHVRAVFAAQRTSNVLWVWCVNVQGAGAAALKSLYPGDGAVDWVALDGYNGGTALPWGGWLTPTQIFGSTLRAVRQLTRHPVVISEVASAEQGGDKAAWIQALFTLARKARVRAVIWFEYNKETDWRLLSNSHAADAFRQQVTARGRLGPPP